MGPTKNTITTLWRKHEADTPFAHEHDPPRGQLSKQKWYSQLDQVSPEDMIAAITSTENTMDPHDAPPKRKTSSETPRVTIKLRLKNWVHDFSDQESSTGKDLPFSSTRKMTLVSTT